MTKVRFQETESNLASINRNLFLTIHIMAPVFKMNSRRFFTESLNFGHFEKMD